MSIRELVTDDASDVSVPADDQCVCVCRGHGHVSSTFAATFEIATTASRSHSPYSPWSGSDPSRWFPRAGHSCAYSTSTGSPRTVPSRSRLRPTVTIAPTIDRADDRSHHTNRFGTYRFPVYPFERPASGDRFLQFQSELPRKRLVVRWPIQRVGANASERSNDNGSPALPSFFSDETVRAGRSQCRPARGRTTGAGSTAGP